MSSAPTAAGGTAIVTYPEAADARRNRRELGDEEFTRLLAAARSGPRRCGLTGAERAVLYQVAVGTGFRQAACLSLTRASFFVESKRESPYVRLGAAFNKNGKDRDQLVRPDLAALLREWLKGKPAEGCVWKTKPKLMVRRDLEAARAGWVGEAANPKERMRREESVFLTYRDASGRYADFHSLRHTGISRVVRKVGLKAGQVWADHSTPVLTSRYAHLNLADERKSLEALPEADDGGEARRTARGSEKAGKTRKNVDGRKIG